MLAIAKSNKQQRKSKVRLANEGNLKSLAFPSLFLVSPDTVPSNMALAKIVTGNHKVEQMNPTNRKSTYTSNDYKSESILK